MSTGALFPSRSSWSRFCPPIWWWVGKPSLRQCYLKQPLMPLETSFLYSKRLAYSAVKITIWYMSVLLLLCHFRSYCSCSAIFLNKYPHQICIKCIHSFYKGSENRDQCMEKSTHWRFSCLLRPSHIYIYFHFILCFVSSHLLGSVCSCTLRWH